MFNTLLKLIQTFVGLIYAFRKVIEKKLTKGKINDLSGLIVTTLVLLSVQAFNTLLILLIMDNLLVYLNK